MDSDLRALFSAGPGQLLVDGDWSGIELRLAAHLYGEEGVIQALREGADLHCRTAEAIYGRRITKENKAERAVGKTANFGLIYGCGVRSFRPRLSAALGREVSEEETWDAIRGWERANPATTALRNQHRAHEPWEVRSATGRIMQDKQVVAGVPGERFSDAVPKPIRSPTAMNWPIQSSGAELLKHSLALLMPRLWDAFGGRVRVAHLVHDEILLTAPVELAQQAAQLLKATMEDPVLATTYLGGKVPLVAEVRVGATWAQTH